jgi:hypothetical protein
LPEKNVGSLLAQSFCEEIIWILIITLGSIIHPKKKTNKRYDNDSMII